ncbi:hypothetical protein FEM48_Zijuj03G0159800 [Ziziphus jujuba var. spinosa]|uniref:Kinesin-like protein KIN-10C n=1 Tax=Ziziphus jujuba var. spinosa TaxID=714518 RepID=A0A978VR92_ZIZJJ|nr:hypothetical protein FEM48_Zijuj03G0159800 [Ziziphus jujuba var. spinosa]
MQKKLYHSRMCNSGASYRWNFAMVEKDVPVEEGHLEEVTLSVNSSEKTLNFDKEGNIKQSEISIFCNSTPCVKMPEENDASSYALVPLYTMEPKTPMVDQSITTNDRWEADNFNSPRETFCMRSSGVKNSTVQECLKFFNTTSSREELERLKGIGEKRASYILELHEESPKPFKRVNGMMKKEVGEPFNKPNKYSSIFSLPVRLLDIYGCGNMNLPWNILIFLTLEM